MTPLPQNQTGVYFVDYSFRGNQHTMSFRLGQGVVPGDIDEDVSAFLDSLSTLMDFTWKVDGARYRAPGSNISLPVQPPFSPAGAQVEVPKRWYPRFVSFGGRGETSGRRARVYVYGLFIDIPDDYRFSASEETRIGAAISALTDLVAQGVTTIAGDPFLVEQYANVGVNAYYQRKQRG